MTTATDPYDFRAPGFVPDEFNSLIVTEKAGHPLMSASDQELAAERMRLAFRDHPDVDYGDTEVVMYDGDLYIVGDYIRHLMKEG